MEKNKKIIVRNLSFLYSPQTAFERKALDNVSFSIESGEFIGLIGHTGSGKSTLIQHLNGLLIPAIGEILIDGENIHIDKKKLKSIRQRVGLVFQYPEHQLFEMTIWKDVAFGPENMGLSPTSVKKRVEEALEAVGIDSKLYEKSPFELSGGQKRRVAIAGVLAMRPEVLILDEPTAGLDPQGRDEILIRIRHLHQHLNITVILVSHSMEDIARMTNRILVMHQGKLVYDDTPKAVFRQVKALEAMGLAAPQISYLMDALKKSGLPVPADIFTVEEANEVLSKLLSRCHS